jgi:hypothetical protein
MNYNNENHNELLNLNITSNNSITINLIDFKLSTLYSELHDFHASYDLANQLFFAYPFNIKGLLYEKHPISGYRDSYRPLSIITSGILSNEDIEFFFNLEYKIDNEYVYLYKYNVLNLYIQLKIALALELDEAMEENLSEFCVFEDKTNFSLFISKYDISKTNLKHMVEDYYKNL